MLLPRSDSPVDQGQIIGLGVVIPARDEVERIADVVRSARKLSATVLVVDDGSSDDTARVAKQAGATVLSRQESGGQGRAVRDGIRQLTAIGIDHVLTLDGDGAHDASDGQLMWHHHVRTGADLTLGSRFMIESVVPIVSTKVAPNKFAALVINQLFETDLTDVATGMRILGPRSLCLPFQVNDFGFAFEVIQQCSAAKMKIIESPISVRYDAAEPLVTRRSEALNFLMFCQRCNSPKSPSLVSEIDDIVSSMNQWKLIKALIGGHTFFLHPIPAWDSYLFQEQTTRFDSHTD